MVEILTTCLLSVPPDPDQLPKRPYVLPDGVQQIFTPEEESDVAENGAGEVSFEAVVEGTEDATAVAVPALKHTVPNEDLLSQAITAVPDLVNVVPIMHPGSPAQILGEFSSSSQQQVSPDSLSPQISPQVSQQDFLSPQVSQQQVSQDSLFEQQVSSEEALSGIQMSSRSSLTEVSTVATFSTETELPASQDLTASVLNGTTATVALLTSNHGPSPWSQWRFSSKVGRVQPQPSQQIERPNSSTPFLHDYLPGQMLSSFTPANLGVLDNFHNLISRVFVENQPSSNKGLLQAMAKSLEHRQSLVLHGVQLPDDRGLQPEDPLHMAVYLYVAALFDEFEDYLQAALKDSHEDRQLLRQEKEKLQGCQDQLQKLREVNALLSKTNSPVERQKIIRLEQDLRKSEQTLQEVTHDFNELQALAENLRKELDGAEEQRKAATTEAQENHEKLQLSKAELSKMKIKMISKSSSDQETRDLKADLQKTSFQLEESKKQSQEQKLALEEMVSKCQTLSQQQVDMETLSAEKSRRLAEAEKQLEDLSEAKQQLDPLIAEAKLEKVKSQSRQAEMVSMQEHKKKLLKDLEDRDSKIVSLKNTIETMTKEKKEVSDDSLKQLEKSKEVIDKLRQEKAKLSKQVEEDAKNCFDLNDKLDAKEKQHLEALQRMDGDIAELKSENQVQQAITASLREELNISKNTALDLQEQLDKNKKSNIRGKTRKYFKKLIKHMGKDAFPQVFGKEALQEETGSESSQDESANEDEFVAEERKAPLSTPSPTASESAPKPENSQKHSLASSTTDKKSQSQQASKQSSSEGETDRKNSQDEGLVLETSFQDRMSLESQKSEKRGRSKDESSQYPRNKRSKTRSEDSLQEKRASSPSQGHSGSSKSGRNSQPSSRQHGRLSRSHSRTQRRSSHSQSQRRSTTPRSPSPTTFRRSPPRQRESQLHYDLDIMTDERHEEALTLIKQYTAESRNAIAKDKHLLNLLRGSSTQREKSATIKNLLQGYAQCTNLEELTEINQGTPPSPDNCFQPLPDLSSDSAEWEFIQSEVKNHFVHFPSTMALFRLYSSKVYAFFHYGKRCPAPRQKETIALLSTPDKDHNNIKRSTWEKKLDLLLTLICGRLVFYTLDDVSLFECNSEKILYLTEDFLSDAFMEQMIQVRTYQDPYLLPRRMLYRLYTDSYGRQAKRDFNYRISRYEPQTAPSEDRDCAASEEKPSTFSWVNQ